MLGWEINDGNLLLAELWDACKKVILHQIVHIGNIPPYSASSVLTSEKMKNNKLNI